MVQCLHAYGEACVQGAMPTACLSRWACNEGCTNKKKGKGENQKKLGEGEKIAQRGWAMAWRVTKKSIANTLGCNYGHDFVWYGIHTDNCGNCGTGHWWDLLLKI
eukprot:766651-Pelagomonas_calceolata.AAC.5